MPNCRAIEIDFDIHKLIETNRQSFDESPNEVLRRLLKLETSSHVRPPSELTQASERPARRPWTGEGEVLPHGTLLHMNYSGNTYEGQIIDGKWNINGQVFDSPSGAASSTAITRRGTKTKLDGWIYWRVKRPEDTGWIPIIQLRPKIDAATLEDLGL